MMARAAFNLELVALQHMHLLRRIMQLQAAGEQAIVASERMAPWKLPVTGDFNMFGRLLLGFAGLSLATAAAAQPSSNRISVDGVTADYAKSVDAAGALHLEGRFVETREPFHFIVAPDGRAHGNVAGRDVRFRVARSVREAAVGQAGSRTAAAKQIALAAEPASDR